MDDDDDEVGSINNFAIFDPIVTSEMQRGEERDVGIMKCHSPLMVSISFKSYFHSLSLMG